MNIPQAKEKVKHYVIFGLFILLLGLFSFDPASKVQPEVAGVTSAPFPTPTSTPSLTPTPTPNIKPKVTVTSNPAPIPTHIPTPNSTNPSANSISDQSAAVPQTFQVTLTVTGQSATSINIPEGSNHCDVLTKAQEQGKISQLNMRYESSYGSYAVYQIDGIGKENSVWWVYKVNGASPNQGCSYINVNTGDNIEWEYIGPK